jgi:hypothetical protein
MWDINSVAALFFILPIVAFDVWLALTTGRHQWAKWRDAANWRPAILTAVVSVLLAVLFAFVQYKYGSPLKLTGFPVPFDFSSFQDKHWVPTSSPPPLQVVARVTDILTGLIAPLIPFKIAEFLRVVKKEIN